MADVMKASKHRALKMLVYGDYGSGKTRFLLGLFQYLEMEGLKPKDVQVLLIDCDNGTIPLIQGGMIKAEWWPSLQYARAKSFEDAVAITRDHLPALEKWQAEHGIASAWVLVDNMKFAYEEQQDAYAMRVYGISRLELAQKRREAAQTKGKTGFALFDPKHDWGIITGRHNLWTNIFTQSTLNFIWATPEKHFSMKEKDEKGEYTIDAERAYPGGQPDNRGKADEVVRLWVDVDDNMRSKTYGKRTFYATLDKSRAVLNPTKWLRGAEDPSFPKLMGWYKAKTKEQSQ